MTEKCIIIGASHAAAQLCVSLRQGGWDGSITVIGDEDDMPYHRPPLSKDFLSGDKTLSDILIRPAEIYEKANIDLKLGVRVVAINREEKSVLTDDGDVYPYDKLVLTTGARVRNLPVPGEDLKGVYYLRDTKDVLEIKSQVALGKRAVIIGGGYIGLETGASLKKQGMEVTILEAMPRILKRVTAPELSRFYKRVHQEEGINILEGVVASEILKSNDRLTVSTSCQQNFDADLVIIGIGVIPNMELAEMSGLTVGNGIEVNAFCQTSDSDIYAAGDVTWHFNPIYGRHVRLESVPNATEQAKTVASHINGQPKPYNSLPWFWSDQFDLKLQIAGLSDGYDDLIIRGDIENSRGFAAFYFKGDQLLAVDAVNSPREFMLARMVLGQGKTLDKKAIRDETADLKTTII
tara:strand:+ start:6856 stop:8076 length:1221 start_codon:yes stop_codon:yes gene_type:complete